MIDIFQAFKLAWTPTLVLLGTILNLLTIAIFVRIKKNILSSLMVCLAIADICVLVVPLFLTWVDEIFFDFYYLNNTICN